MRLALAVAAWLLGVVERTDPGAASPGARSNRTAIVMLFMVFTSLPDPGRPLSGLGVAGAQLGHGAVQHLLGQAS